MRIERRTTSSVIIRPQTRLAKLFYYRKIHICWLEGEADRYIHRGAGKAQDWWRMGSLFIYYFFFFSFEMFFISKGVRVLTLNYIYSSLSYLKRQNCDCSKKEKKKKKIQFAQYRHLWCSWYQSLFISAYLLQLWLLSTLLLSITTLYL